jgi:lipid A disaccharide synthetase
LPNILAGRMISPELIQSRATVANVVAEMTPLLADTSFSAGAWKVQHDELCRIHTRLQSENVSSAAAAVLSLVEEESPRAIV